MKKTEITTKEVHISYSYEEFCKILKALHKLDGEVSVMPTVYEDLSSTPLGYVIISTQTEKK